MSKLNDYTFEKITDLTAARRAVETLTEYQRVEVHAYNRNRIGECTGTSVYGADKLGTIDPENFSHALVVTGPYPMELRNEDLVTWLAERGIAADFTYRFDKGVRAGLRTGYASECTANGEHEAVQYGPEGSDPYPYGTKRNVLATF